jgi:hypothetical protein
MESVLILNLSRGLPSSLSMSAYLESIACYVDVGYNIGDMSGDVFWAVGNSGLGRSLVFISNEFSSDKDPPFVASFA